MNYDNSPSEGSVTYDEYGGDHSRKSAESVSPQGFTRNVGFGTLKDSSSSEDNVKSKSTGKKKGIQFTDATRKLVRKPAKTYF